MLEKYFFCRLPKVRIGNGRFFFKRTFSENKKNVEVQYIKESKKKYIFYTLASSLLFSISFTYAYEKYFLYKWNYEYDYYYNPNIKDVGKEGERKRENERERERERERKKEKENENENTNTETDANKENKKKTKKEKTVMKNIILVRHGQYERRYKDEESKYLTKEGLKQAEITGKKLKDILNGKKIKVIYHSNVKRAIETAQIISKFFPDSKLINDPNLDEGVPYLPDPIPKNSKFEPQKIKEDNKRINKAYETYFYKPDENDEDSYHLIICHGNVIRYFLCRALQIPLFAWLRFSSYNCGITWLVLDDEGSVVLREFGSVSHLPFESVTYF